MGLIKPEIGGETIDSLYNQYKVIKSHLDGAELVRTLHCYASYLLNKQFNLNVPVLAFQGNYQFKYSNS